MLVQPALSSRTCLAGRFLGWTLHERPRIGKRRLYRGPRGCAMIGTALAMAVEDVYTQNRRALRSAP
jgi:hypothetical protein